MIRKYTTVMVAVFLFGIFCATVFIHEHQAHKKVSARIVSHAGIVADFLWNYNHAGAVQYLALACKTDNYTAIRVMDIRGEIFQQAGVIRSTGISGFFQDCI